MLTVTQHGLLRACFLPLGQICKFFAFLSGKLYRRLISAWREFQSWAEVVLDVLGVAPAHLGFFPGIG